VSTASVSTASVSTASVSTASVSTASVSTAKADGEASARPMRADAVKNRQRILDAAEAVFASEGLSVPVDVVAERAGVGVGTLYRHFPTKEALFEAIVVTRLQHLVRSADEMATADDPGEALFAFLRTFGHQASEKHDFVDALSIAGIDIKSSCAANFDELQAGIRRLIDRAAASGAVREDVTSAEVIGLVVGACHAAGQSGLGATSDRMIEVVCDGLRRRT
jgi:AcrR family transcriptional regulator